MNAVCRLCYRYGDVHQTIICECVLKSIKFGIKVPNERAFIHYVCFCFIFAPNVIYYSGQKIWKTHIESATWRMLVEAEGIKSFWPVKRTVNQISGVIWNLHLNFRFSCMCKFEHRPKQIHWKSLPEHELTPD